MGCHTSKAAVSSPATAKVGSSSKSAACDRARVPSTARETSPCSSTETTDPQVALLTSALQAQAELCEPSSANADVHGCSAVVSSLQVQLEDGKPERVQHTLDDTNQATSLRPDNTDDIPADDKVSGKSIEQLLSSKPGDHILMSALVDLPHPTEQGQTTLPPQHVSQPSSMLVPSLRNSSTTATQSKPSVFGPREEDLPLPSLLVKDADNHALPMLLGRTSLESQVKWSNTIKSTTGEIHKPAFVDVDKTDASDGSFDVLYSCMGLRQQVKECSGMTRKV